MVTDALQPSQPQIEDKRAVLVQRLRHERIHRQMTHDDVDDSPGLFSSRSK